MKELCQTDSGRVVASELLQACSNSVPVSISFNSQTILTLDEIIASKGNPELLVSARILKGYFKSFRDELTESIVKDLADKICRKEIKFRDISPASLLKLISQAVNRNNVVFLFDEPMKVLELDANMYEFVRSMIMKVAAIQDIKTPKDPFRATVIFSGVLSKPFLGSASATGRPIKRLALPCISPNRYHEFFDRNSVANIIHESIRDNVADPTSLALFNITGGFPRVVEIFRDKLKSSTSFDDLLNNVEREISMRYCNGLPIESCMAAALLNIPLETNLHIANSNLITEDLLNKSYILTRSAEAREKTKDIVTNFEGEVANVDILISEGKLFVGNGNDNDDARVINPYIPPLFLRQAVKNVISDSSTEWLKLLHAIMQEMLFLDPTLIKWTRGSKGSISVATQGTTSAFERINTLHERFLRSLRSKAKSYIPKSYLAVKGIKYNRATLTEAYRLLDGNKKYVHEKFISQSSALRFDFASPFRNIQMDCKSSNIPLHGKSSDCQGSLFVMEPNFIAFERAWVLTGKVGKSTRDILFLEQDKFPLARNFQDPKEIINVIKNALMVASSRNWKKEDVVIVIKTFRPLYTGNDDLLEELRKACEGTTLLCLCGEDYKRYLGPTMWDLLMCSPAVGPLVAANSLNA